MTKKILIKRSRSKPSARRALAFRLVVLALAIGAIGVFGFLNKNILAQSWSEPTGAPPSNNATGPVWAQNSLAQTGNFWLSGKGRLDTSGIGDATCQGAKVCLADSTGGYGLVSEMTSGTGGAGPAVYAQGNAGFGIYASSTSNYAGDFVGNVYVSGTLNAGTALQVNSTNVCLSDGTNCPPTSASTLVLTNAKYSYTAAPPATACSSEFGSNYKNASILDLLVNMNNSTIVHHPNMVGFVDGDFLVTTQNSYNNGYSVNTSVSGTTYTVGDFSSGTFASTEQVLCVRKNAPVEFTAATYSNGSAPPATACSSEYGANYKDASALDLSLRVGRYATIKTNSSYSPAQYEFLTTTVNNNSRYGAYITASDIYPELNSFSSSVACVNNTAR